MAGDGQNATPNPTPIMPPFQIAMLALAGVSELIKVISAVRENAKQNGEWTPEQEVEFQAKLKSTFAAPHWQVAE